MNLSDIIEQLVWAIGYGVVFAALSYIILSKRDLQGA